MGETLVYKFHWLKNSEVWNSYIDQLNMEIVDNELLGIYQYIGQGIVDGWDVVSWIDGEYSETNEDLIISKGLSPITQSEIDNLSNTTKNSLNNLNYKMIIKTTEGDGIVGVWAGFTTSDCYYAFPQDASNHTYYVWSVPTDALPEPLKHKAQILINEDSSYDEDNIAVYLATVTVIYNSTTKQQYISAISVEEDRRIELYQLKGLAVQEIKDLFLKHVHDGVSSPKIVLSTKGFEEIIERESTIKSPIYIFDPIELKQSLDYGPEILSIETISTGGSLTTGRWYYAISFVIFENGEEKESLIGDKSFIDIGTEEQAVIKWEKVSGATSYNIYRSEESDSDGSALYQLANRLTLTKFEDDGQDLITPLIQPQNSFEQEIQTNDFSFDKTITYYTGDETFTVNEDGSVESLSYQIPGIFESNQALGANRDIKDILAQQDYYKAEVLLNGETLNPNDYKLSLRINSYGYIELKNNIKSDDKLEIVLHINPTQTQVSGSLSKNRISFLNAESIRYGTIPKRFIKAPNHYGNQRIKEIASLEPYSNMRTQDYLKYTIQDPNAQIQYDDEIIFVGRVINADSSLGVPVGDSNSTDVTDSEYYSFVSSTNTLKESIGGNDKYLVGARNGNYLTENFQFFEKIENLSEDEGIVVAAIDNLVLGSSGGFNRYFETYVLLNTGKVLYSNDNLITWNELRLPYTNFIATAFSVRTGKFYYETPESTIDSYWRQFYVAGYSTGENSVRGLWSGKLDEPLPLTSIPWSKNSVYDEKIVYDIKQLATESFSETSSTYKLAYPETVFIATNSGLYVSHVLKSPYESGSPVAISPKKIYLINQEHVHEDDKSNLPFDEQFGMLNNVIFLTDDAIYTTHSAEYYETTQEGSNGRGWNHPLTKTISRPYKIADIDDFDGDFFTAIGESYRFLMTGTDENIWYGLERLKGAGEENEDLSFLINVSGYNSTSLISFHVEVESGVSYSDLSFQIYVDSAVGAQAILEKSDEDYSKYFGWELTSWNKTKFGEFANNPYSFSIVSGIDQYGYGPPQKEAGIGRTGPLSGKSYEEEQSDKYIDFDWQTSSTNVIFQFANGVSLTATNTTAKTGSGTGSFEIETKIFWIDTLSYRILITKTNDSIVSTEFERYLSQNNSFPSNQNPASATALSIDSFGDSTDNEKSIITPNVVISPNLIIGSKHGIWYSKGTDGSSIQRTYDFWNKAVEPNVYLNDEIVDDSLYTINQVDQSVTFLASQNIYNKIMIEKDFREYFLVNGTWEQTDADILVYVNNKPTSVQWTAFPDNGMIRFDQRLTRDDFVNLSLISKGAYLTNVGTTPHEEIGQGYVENDDYTSRLSQALNATSNIIQINAATFPTTTRFISISGEIISVEIRDISPTTRTVTSFRILQPRSSSVEYAIGTVVKLVEIKSILGIQDYLSMDTSFGIPYNFHSLITSNHMRLTGTLREIYPEITGDETLIAQGLNSDTTIVEGHINSYYHDFDLDNLDDLNTFDTLFDGIETSENDNPVESIHVYCSYRGRLIGEIGEFNQTNSIVGTNKGIWKKRSGGYWDRVSSCDDCTRVYFIKPLRGNVWAGTDNGIWISEDEGETWSQSSTFYQNVFQAETGQINWQPFKTNSNSSGIELTRDIKTISYSDGGWTTSESTESIGNDSSQPTSKYFEAFLKSDGLSFVLYLENVDGTGDFNSDHLANSDGYDLRFLANYEQISDGLRYQSQILTGGENGLYSLENLEGIETTDDFISDLRIDSVGEDRPYFYGPRVKINSSGSEENILEQLIFYDFFLNPRLPHFDLDENSVHDRFGNIDMLILTNDGIKISRDWMFAGNAGASEAGISWYKEPLKGEGYTCFSHICISDPDTSNDYDSWKHFRIFVGTNKGIVWSLNGYEWMPLNKFPDGTAAVYNFEYTDEILYAFTSKGVYFSDDLGESWQVSSEFNFSNYYYLANDLKLSQTFKPISEDITKISVFLNRRKDLNLFNETEEYTYEYQTTVTLSLFATDVNGAPTGSALQVSTTELTADLVNEGRWYTFELERTLNTNNYYAIVLEEENNSFDTRGFVSWGISSTYEQGKSFEYSDEWSELFNEDHNFFFIIHYDAETNYKISEYSVDYDKTKANNIAVTTLNNLVLDLRFVFSFVVDATGSMVWQDSLAPLNDIYGSYDDDLRIEKLLDLMEKLLARSRWSYVDLWHFDTRLRHTLTDGLTRDISTIEAAIRQIISSGTDSEVWSGSSLAAGNAFYEGVKDALIRDDDYDFAIYYMDAMKRLNTAELQAIDSRYDGNASTLLLDEFVNLRDYVINDFIYSYAKSIFVATDGFDSVDDGSSWRDLALTVSGFQETGNSPLFMFGLGDCNNQTEMIAACEETSGSYFNILNNLDKWDDAFDEILNGEFYIWNGLYEDEIDFDGEINFVQWIKCPAIVPSTSSVKFEIRTTKDFNIWSDWLEIPVNQEYLLKRFVTMIEYRITLTQGDTVSGDPEYFSDYYYDNYSYEGIEDTNYPSPIIGAISYGIVSPSRQYYFTETLDSNGKILEYLLTHNFSFSELSVVNFYVARGDTLDRNLYNKTIVNKKDVFNIRESSIYFVPESSMTYEMTDIGNAFLFAAFPEGGGADERITWSNTDDDVSVFVDNQLINIETTPYRTDGTAGIVEFLSAVSDGSVVSLQISTAAASSTKKGEITIKLNNTTFQAINGAWPHDATTIVYRNSIPIFSGFILIPEDGLIIFDDYILDTEDIKIAIFSSDNYRIMLEIVNYSDVLVVLNNFSFMYSTTSIENSDLDILTNSTPPVVSDDVELVTSDYYGIETEYFNNSTINNQKIMTRHGIPYVKYSFSHEEDLEESDSEIRWYRKRKNESVFSEVESYRDFVVKKISDEIEDYSPSASGVWTDGDTWKVSVKPKTQNADGLVYTSNEIVVGKVYNKQIVKFVNTPPVIYGLEIVTEDTSSLNTFYPTDPTNFSAVKRLDLRYSTELYTYYSIPATSTDVLFIKFNIYDPEEDDEIILNNSIVTWYLNGNSTPSYDSSKSLLPTNGKWSMPKLESNAGNVTWYCEIIPFDGINYGMPIKSYSIFAQE